MSANIQTPEALSEATAIRLYNSVAVNDGTNLRPTVLTLQSQIEINEQKSIETVQSANEFGNSCRICRWNRSDMEILKSPCLCKGSVGFVHLQCLKRWIMHRKDKHCEICNETFDIPEEKLNIRRMLQSFCTCCSVPILKHISYSASLIPLTHVILQQVLVLMENINQSPHEQLKTSEVLMASSALLTSSALFFHFFEFITTRLITIRTIIRRWWLFGNASDFPLIELESDILDFFG